MYRKVVQGGAAILVKPDTLPIRDWLLSRLLFTLPVIICGVRHGLFRPNYSTPVPYAEL
ncbi:hypothetical protein [Limosilactobacillus sp.]|uniref:hypothetical protein n=1 Tax=Limosilactobacillus sp. TaxID=2773925 RepID=UPI00345E4ADE